VLEVLSIEDWSERSLCHQIEKSESAVWGLVQFG